MMRRRCFVLAFAVAWLIALVLVGKRSLDRLTVPPWGNSTQGGHAIEVVGETQVGQRFRAPWPGLYRIEVVLDPASAGGEHEVIFHLKSDPAAMLDLWTTSFRTTDVETKPAAAGPAAAGLPYAFEFDPIRDSKGRDYYFYLESSASVPGDAVAVHYSPYAYLESAGAYLDGQPVPGDLQFSTYYSLRTRDKIDLLLTRMAAGRSYFLGHKAFYAGLAVVYVLVLGLFLWLVAKVVLQKERS